MKPRDRVAAALSREQPDRCPMQVSFTPEFATRLRGDPRLRAALATGSTAPDRTHNPHGGGNTHELERALGQDLLLTSVGWANSYYLAAEPGATYTDEWGVGWRACPYTTPFGRGIYTEMVSHPLAGDSALASFEPPDPRRPHLYDDARELIARFGGDYFIVGVTVTTIFETAWALRGLERLLTDMLLDPPLVDRILDIPFNYHLAAARRLAELGVDMIWTGDDIGAQHGLIIHPDLWRRFLKPRMARLIRDVKEINPGIKVAYHSDGAIYPLVAELIEIGVDVLNPLQPACVDPARLKAEFGDRLCFWGSIDEQHTLPFGTPEDVRREVRTRLETVGQGGGLILGPTHHVQLDTPLENFWAMIDSIHAPAD